MGRPLRKDVLGTDVIGTPITAQTFVVTAVPNPAGSGAIYQIDGVNKPVLNLVRMGVYTFVQAAASNVTHQIAFRNADDSAFTAGVVTTGVLGTAGSQTVFTVPANAPDNLKYYCVAHGNNMGNTITVTDDRDAGITVSFHDGNTVQTDGIIVKQRGAKSFVVARMGTPFTRFTCVLVDGTPAAGQMRIVGLTNQGQAADNGAVAVAKLTKRLATGFNGIRYTWYIENDSSEDYIVLTPVAG